MAKNAKRSASSKTKTFLGASSLFVVIWLIVITLLAGSGWLPDLLVRFGADSTNLIIGIILLAPIAIAVFPQIYWIDDI